MTCVLKSLDAERKVTKLVVKHGNVQDTTFVILGTCDWMEKFSDSILAGSYNLNPTLYQCPPPQETSRENNNTIPCLTQQSVCGGELL